MAQIALPLPEAGIVPQIAPKKAPCVGSTVIATYGRKSPDRASEWTGIVLPSDSPEAWRGSLAFGEDETSAERIRAHIASCEARGIPMTDRVPVRWEFGRVYWEKPADLREIEGA